MLAHTLSCHPQLKVLGEILDAGPNDHWPSFRRSILRCLDPQSVDVGPDSDLIPLFEYLFNEYQGFLIHRDGQIAEGNPAWHYLASRADLVVIHLYRENLFRQFLSEQVALKTGIWHCEVGKPLPPTPAVRVDPADCIRVMVQRKARFEQLRRLFAGLPHVCIRYEDIQADVHRTLAYCQGFLGVEIRTLTVAFRKRTPQPTSELVSNFVELRECLANTEFVKFLDC